MTTEPEANITNSAQYISNVDTGCWYRHPDVIVRSVAGEHILVPFKRARPDLQELYTLNEVGVFLWQELSSKKTRDELAVALLERYNVNTEQAQLDVSNYLFELQSCNLVVYESN